MSNFSIHFSFDSLPEAITFLQSIPSDACVQGTSLPAAAASSASKAPRKRAAPAEAAPAPVAAPAPAQAAPVADTAELKKTAIQKLLTLINANDALGRNGKQVCTDLCNTFGGKNISTIDPSKYAAVIAAVDKALEALNSDPTA